MNKEFLDFLYETHSKLKREMEAMDVVVKFIADCSKCGHSSRNEYRDRVETAKQHLKTIDSIIVKYLSIK